MLNDQTGDLTFFEFVEARNLMADAYLRYYLCRFNVSAYTENLYREFGIAGPERVMKSVTKRQAEFLAGRRCAQVALAEHGIVGFEVKAGSNREPIWPDGLVGSITHKGSYAAAAVCRSDASSGVGIDIETIVGDSKRGAIMSLVVSDAELSYLSSLGPDLSLNHLLTLAFSSKESFFKAAFPSVKRHFGFSALRITEIDFHNKTLRLQVVQPISDTLAEGQVHVAHFEFIDKCSIFTSVLLAAGRT